MAPGLPNNNACSPRSLPSQILPVNKTRRFPTKALAHVICPSPREGQSRDELSRMSLVELP